MFRFYTAQKMKFSIKDFFSKCDQIRRELQIWSHLLKKSLMENFISCAVLVTGDISIKGENRHKAVFKNCAPFTNCITKIDVITIDDSEDLHLIMFMYNLENTALIIPTQRFYDFIIKMKQLVLMLILLIVIILNLSNIMLNY